jgi:hypothetical protein
MLTDLQVADEQAYSVKRMEEVEKVEEEEVEEAEDEKAEEAVMVPRDPESQVPNPRIKIAVPLYR